MTSLAILVRRTAAVASRKQVPTLLFKGLSTQSKHPNPEGPAMAGYREFLDDMEAKTSKMEASMESLKDTYAKKQTLSRTVKWTDPAEIEYLFDTAAKQKEEILQQIADLKLMTKAAKSNYAVDAPDGESDGHFEEELEQVDQIIDNDHTADKQKEAAQQQAADLKATKKAAQTNYAVDAPDGESDGHLEEELEEVNHIIDDSAQKK